MKKILLHFLLTFSFQMLMAQKINIGSLEKFSALLKNKTVSLPGNINFTINSKESGENITEYSGVLLTPNRGGVHFRIDNQKAEGEIIAPEFEQTWQISSENGIVYLEQTKLEDRLCIEDETHKPVIETASGNFRTQATTVESRKLQSYPLGKAVIYIDFDGHNVTDTWWINNYNNGQPWYCTPANISADNEISVWKVVSEDYRPFNVNVTTDSTIFLQYPATERQRLIVTRNASWQTLSTTGIGRIGGFGFYTSGQEASPCFSFPGGFSSSNSLSSSAAEKLGEVSSHELGHAFGLKHDGTSTVNYYSGHGTWAPIMGSGYNKVCTQWSKGEYYNANNKEDDLSIITGANNGFGYKTDDHGNNYITASVLTIVSDSVKLGSTPGLIETSTDVDVFKFSVSASSAINLIFKTFEVKPNLDIKVKLYKSDNTLVISNDISGSQNASLTTSIPAGDYYILVDGVGYGDPLSTGYSEYASIGFYTIYGVIPNAKKTSSTGNLLPSVSITSPLNNVSITSKTNLTITASASDADGIITKVEFYNGNNLLSTVYRPPYQYVWQNITAGNYTFIAKAYDDSSASTVSSLVNVTVKDTIIYSCSAPAWSSNTIYWGGDEASYNGHIYRAKYWTQNNNPATSDNWLEIGSCETLTSLSTNEENAQISMYPNPSNGLVYFSELLEDVSVNDLIGEEVYRSTSSCQSIDISQLRKGIYFITLKYGNASFVYKLIKE